MSWNLTEEVELIMFPNDDNWSSANSIITQKVQKLSKPDLAGSLPELISNVTIKEVEIQKCQSRIPEHWDEKNWGPANARFKFPLSKSWTQHEVDILKINLSSQEKNIDLTESDGDKKKSKSFRELFHGCGGWNCMKTLAKKKIRDLMVEIEGSETAKKDTKAWKFLQRASALRKELVNSRRYLEVQDWFSLGHCHKFTGEKVTDYLCIDDYYRMMFHFNAWIRIALSRLLWVFSKPSSDR